MLAEFVVASPQTSHNGVPQRGWLRTLLRGHQDVDAVSVVVSRLTQIHPPGGTTDPWRRGGTAVRRHQQRGERCAHRCTVTWSTPNASFTQSCPRPYRRGHSAGQGTTTMICENPNRRTRRAGGRTGRGISSSCPSPSSVDATVPEGQLPYCEINGGEKIKAVSRRVGRGSLSYVCRRH
jgi:hypothetical protein